MNDTYQKIIENEKAMEWQSHAVKILNFDLETVAPEGGQADDSEDMSRLQDNIIALKRQNYPLLTALRNENYQADNIWQRRLLTLLYREQDQSEPIDPALESEAAHLFNESYAVWLKAKQDNDYEAFRPQLEKIAAMERKLIAARKISYAHPYDGLIGPYEYGFSTADLDPFFDTLERNIVPLLKKVSRATYVPRHDFLNRKVPLAKQEEFTKKLLAFNGFDFKRGSISTTEHPFTEQFGQNDVRITTKYIETAFVSNMYSVIHEGGHALFGQNIPAKTFEEHLGEGSLSMAKHESVSRFYENLVGRSRPYIHAIYPWFHELFQEELGDISEDDLYEGVNYVDLSNPVRTEADELTYSLHIVIRYRLEKEIMANPALDFRVLKQQWNDLYRDLLGVTVPSDRAGILQDVHWASGFGYFPTYAMGNALGASYIKVLDHDLNFDAVVGQGDMAKVLMWMREHVFASAPLKDTKDWIQDITGHSFTADDYVEYLTHKFTELYHLD